jgi:hypothetical protein
MTLVRALGQLSFPSVTISGMAAEGRCVFISSRRDERPHRTSPAGGSAPGSGSVE